MTKSAQSSSERAQETMLESGDIPLLDLIEIALREGRRPRPIYQMHKWFARRLPSVFRSVLIAASVPPDADFWASYYAPPDLTSWTVLDPFVGGGTSVVEAQRLGATVVGCDIDPIACAVTEAELSAASMPDLSATLEALKQKVESKMSSFYSLENETEKPLTALHFFWTQVVTCPACQAETDAHHSHVLAEEPNGSWMCCSSCSDISFVITQEPQPTCLKCGAARTKVGNVTNGRVTCNHCQVQSKLIDVARSSGLPPRWKMLAVEAFPSDAKRHPVPNKDRVFLSPSSSLQKRYEAAEEELARLIESEEISLPIQEIDSKVRADKRLMAYGYRKWTDLFNTRQQLHLALLLKEILALPQETQRYFALAFSNHLTTNCLLTSYTSSWRRLTPLFSVRGFRHVTRPVELNPWTAGTGRGSFPNAVRQLTRAAASALNPKEPLVPGGFVDVTDVKPSAPARILNGSAAWMPSLASGSVDLVLSDPPYFDNVAYSDLSDFFQPWLERFSMTTSDKERSTLVSQSIGSSKRNGSGSAIFSRRLGEAFKEIERVLKPNGIVAFTYRHTTAEAWSALTVALSQAKIRPVRVMPVPGEVGSGLHTRPGTCLWDALLVFRKVDETVYQDLVTNEEAHQVSQNVNKWVECLGCQKRLPFTNGDAINLWRATVCAAALGMYRDTPQEAGSTVDQVFLNTPDFFKQETHARPQ